MPRGPERVDRRAARGDGGCQRVLAVEDVGDLVVEGAVESLAATRSATRRSAPPKPRLLMANSTRYRAAELDVLGSPGAGTRRC